MIGDTLKGAVPSFEEGRPRRSQNITLRQVIGAAGEVKLIFQKVSDLPRCAEA